MRSYLHGTPQLTKGVVVMFFGNYLYTHFRVLPHVTFQDKTQCVCYLNGIWRPIVLVFLEAQDLPSTKLAVYIRISTRLFFPVILTPSGPFWCVLSFLFTNDFNLLAFPQGFSYICFRNKYYSFLLIFKIMFRYLIYLSSLHNEVRDRGYLTWLSW